MEEEREDCMDLFFQSLPAEGEWSIIYEEVKKIIEEIGKQQELYIEVQVKAGTVNFLRYLISDRIIREGENYYTIIGNLSMGYLQKDKKNEYKGTKVLLDMRIRHYNRLIKERFGEKKQ